METTVPITYLPNNTDGTMVWNVPIGGASSDSWNTFSMTKQLNVLKGGTYQISIKTNVLQPGISRLTVYYNGVASPINPPIGAASANQWQVTSGQFYASTNLTSISVSSYAPSGNGAVFQVAEIDLVLISAPPTVPTPTLDSNEIIFIDWRSGTDPPPSKSLSSWGEAPSYGAGVVGSGPGYSGRYSHQVQLTSGEDPAANWEIWMTGFALPDEGASYVAKMRYSSANSNGCFVTLAGVPYVSEVVNGCTNQWSELSTDPFVGSSVPFNAIILSCQSYTPVNATFWLDDFRLYKVIQ